MSQSDSGVEVRLVVVGGVHDGRAVPARGTFLIGRAAGCHLRPASDAIAPHHCAIEVREGGPVLVDLGSESGTFLNDDRLMRECPVRDGDELRVGPLRFVVRVAEVAISLAPEEDEDEVELMPRGQRP